MWACGFSSCSLITENTAPTCLSCHTEEVPAVWSPGLHPLARPKLPPETTSVPTEAGTPGPQEQEGATLRPLEEWQSMQRDSVSLTFLLGGRSNPHPHCT